MRIEWEAKLHKRRDEVEDAWVNIYYWSHLPGWRIRSRAIMRWSW